MRVFLLAVMLLLTALPAPAAPRRIISLTPAITEMLFALGAGGRVVGDTTYCDYPPAAKRLPKIGDAMTVSLERITALHPDLIVGDAVASSSALTRLNGIRCPVLTVKPDSFPAIEDSLRRLGRITGTTSQARRVIAGMDAKQHEAARLAAQDTHRPLVLAVVGVAPLWVAGQGTFMNDLLRRAGATNAAAVQGYAAYSKELVLAHPPDVILASPADQAVLRHDPLLGRLPAVRRGRFVFVSDPNLLERPGPRVADGLLQLARALHPGAR